MRAVPVENTDRTESNRVKDLMAEAHEKTDLVHRLEFERVVDFFNGNMAQMARYFGYRRSAICNMRIRGKITAKLATDIDANPDLPFTIDEMRSDYLKIQARNARRAADKQIAA